MPVPAANQEDTLKADGLTGCQIKTEKVRPYAVDKSAKRV
jgi:hypothetical protein